MEAVAEVEAAEEAAAAEAEEAEEAEDHVVAGGRTAAEAYRGLLRRTTHHEHAGVGSH